MSIPSSLKKVCIFKFMNYIQQFLFILIVTIFLNI